VSLAGFRASAFPSIVRAEKVILNFGLWVLDERKRLDSGVCRNDGVQDNYKTVIPFRKIK